MKEEMEHAAALSVPLVVDISEGRKIGTTQRAKGSAAKWKNYCLFVPETPAAVRWQNI